MGTVLLCAGAKGKRFALPNSTIHMHQALGGAQGQAADIEIAAREIPADAGQDPDDTFDAHGPALREGSPRQRPGLLPPCGGSEGLRSGGRGVGGSTGDQRTARFSTRTVNRCRATPERYRPHGEHVCSFCGKAQNGVKRLIAGPGRVFICDECVRLCQQIITEESTSSRDEQANLPGSPSPKEMARRLDEYVIGQDRAKRVLSVAVYNPLQAHPLQLHR